MTATKTNLKEIIDTLPRDESRKLRQSSRTMPEVTNAAVITKFNLQHDKKDKDDLLAIVKDLSELTTSLCDSDKTQSMQDIARMLMNQAQSLNSMFCNLAIRAQDQKYMKNLETYMRLALKAQSQCRATLETLATIKNPPIYANTANIATNQQINNGALPAQPNQTLTHEHGESIPTQTIVEQKVKS